MKKSLSDLIERSYASKPDVDEESEVIGVIVASYNKSKQHYISRFIKTNDDQDIKRLHILRIMLKEIIIQYGVISDIENIEYTLMNSGDMMLNVENFIAKTISGSVDSDPNVEFSKQTERKTNFLKTMFAAITKFFKTVWNWNRAVIKKLMED